MTSYERFANALAHKSVDEIPVAITPWAATIEKWKAQGHLKEGEDVGEHFNQDFKAGGWLKNTVNLDFEPVTVEETDETILQLDGNGATLRQHKLHDSTPEHVDFTVKDRSGWEEFAKPNLVEFDRRRIDFEAYRDIKKIAAEKQRFFCWSGVAPFEQMHPLCGHEYMLMGMAEDADWVKDMVDVYSDMTIKHLEVLFAEEGKPDGMFFFEDMGFKFRPFMSPAMYKDIVMPGHKKLFDYSHSLDCKVIVHSCGFVEPLVPGLIEAGMDCLQAMEVKAGMDMRELFKKYGDRISFFGNIDARALISNDKATIDAELTRKIPPVIKGGGGYILHSDHSEPPDIEYDTIWYFLNRGREVAREAR